VANSLDVQLLTNLQPYSIEGRLWCDSFLYHFQAHDHETNHVEYDHEAFLGEEAEEFDHLSPGQTRNLTKSVSLVQNQPLP
jgi:hypothetical protein